MRVDTHTTRQGVDDIPPHVDTLALDYTLISVDKEAAVLEQFTSLRSLSLSASEYIPPHVCVCVCLCVCVCSRSSDEFIISGE